MHHAFVVFGTPDSGVRALQEYCAGNGIVFNPVDILHIRADGGTVADVRAFQSEAMRLPFGSGHRLVLLSCASLHEEAQQMLLKTFEEPHERIVLGLIVPRGTPLLATLLSRVRLFDDNQSMYKESQLDPNVFIASTPKQRMELVTAFFKSADDEEIMSKQVILGFLEAVEQALLASARAGNQASLSAVRDIETLRPYIFQKGGVPKYVLEYLAVSLPRE